MTDQKFDLVEKTTGEARYVGIVAARYEKPITSAELVVVHVLPQGLDYVCDPAHLRVVQTGLSARQARVAGLALAIQRASADLAMLADEGSAKEAAALYPNLAGGWRETDAERTVKVGEVMGTRLRADP